MTRHEPPMSSVLSPALSPALPIRRGPRAGFLMVGFLMAGLLLWGAGRAAADAPGRAGPADGPKAGDGVEGALLTDLDVPLYAGMREEAEERVIFDSAEGRIIHARARGPALPRKLYDFYRVVLPSLGWTLAAPSRPGAPPEADPDCGAAPLYCLRAERDRESLVIGITRDKRGASLVSFVLTPE